MRRAAPAAVPARSWAAFTRALADVLAALEDRQFLLLVRKGDGTRVEVAGRGNGELRLEATPDLRLEDDQRLALAQRRRLRRLGWRPPAPGAEQGAPARRQERSGPPRHFLDLTGEVDHAAAAALLVATSREVHGVRLPALLTYTAFDEDGRDILLPSLGIEREKASPDRTQEAAVRCPRSAGELRNLVVQALAAGGGRQDAGFDENGDLVLTRREVRVLLRVSSRVPMIDLFSTVLHDVSVGRELYEALNALNNACRRAVLTVIDTRVVASLRLDASTFVPDLLARALADLADAVEECREELRQRFGGRAAREEAPASPPSPVESTVN